jgi:O-antigen/teichoic acid export membrane protein
VLQELRTALGGGALLAVLDQGINSLGNFCTTVIMARALGAHDFGTYSLLFAAMMTVNGLVNTVVAEPVRTLGVSGEVHSRRRYVGAQLIAAAAAGVASALAFAAVVALAAAGLLPAGLTVAAAIVVAGLFEATRALTASRLQWASLLQGDCLAQAAKLGVLYLLLRSASLTLVGGYCAIAVSGCAGALLLGWRGIRPQLPGWQYLLAQVRSHFDYGKWLSLESVVFLLSTQLYLYLIALFGSVSAAGGFNAAQTLVNTVNVVWMGITSFSISAAREMLIADGERAWRGWLRRTGAWLVALVTLLLLAIALLAQPLMSRVFSPAQAAYAGIVPILCVAAVLTVTNSMFNVAFRTINMPQMAFRSKVASAVVTAIIAVPLVRSWGAAGAAVGMCVTQVCWFLVYVWGLRALRPVLPERIRNIRLAYGQAEP